MPRAGPTHFASLPGAGARASPPPRGNVQTLPAQILTCSTVVAKAGEAGNKQGSPLPGISLLSPCGHRDSGLSEWFKNSTNHHLKNDLSESLKKKIPASAGLRWGELGSLLGTGQVAGVATDPGLLVG